MHDVVILIDEANATPQNCSGEFVWDAVQVQDEHSVERFEVRIDAPGVVMRLPGDFVGGVALQVEADEEVLVGEHATHVKHSARAGQNNVVLALVGVVGAAHGGLAGVRKSHWSSE